MSWGGVVKQNKISHMGIAGRQPRRCWRSAVFCGNVYAGRMAAASATKSRCAGVAEAADTGYSLQTTVAISSR